MYTFAAVMVLIGGHDSKHGDGRAEIILERELRGAVGGVGMGHLRLMSRHLSLSVLFSPLAGLVVEPGKETERARPAADSFTPVGWQLAAHPCLCQKDLEAWGRKTVIHAAMSWG